MAINLAHNLFPQLQKSHADPLIPLEGSGGKGNFLAMLRGVMRADPLIPSGRSGGKGNLLAMLRGVMRAGREENINKSSNSHHPVPGKKGETHAYIEILKGGLVAQGSPLDQVYLNKDDLYVVKNLLNQCGYSNKNIGRFINKLLHKNPDVKIRFSEIFNQLEKMGPPRKKKTHSIILNAAVIPHMESVLRDFGLGPKEVNLALNRSRTANGGLDLDKFINKLKTVSRQFQGGLKKNSGMNHFELIRTSANQPDFPVSDNISSGRISISDFISSLERITQQLTGKVKGTAKQLELGPVIGKVEGSSEQQGLSPVAALLNKVNAEVISKEKANSNERGMPAAAEGVKAKSGFEQKLLPDVKASVDKILKKVIISDDKEQSLSSVMSDSKFKHIVNKKGLKFAKESPDAFGDKVEKLTLNHEKQTMNTVPLQEDLKTIGDVVAGKGLKDHMPARMYKEIPKTEPSELVTQSTYQNRGEATSILRTTQPSQSPLPNYLIGHIGRKISQSVINGERVIKLQLKPPELGMVKIEIDFQDNVLKIGVITENSTVKDTLLANMHELRETLSDQGVKLDKLNVQISHSFEQSLTDMKENSKDKYGSGQKDGKTDHFAHEAPPDEEPIYTKGMLSGDYLLDLMA